MATQPTKTTQAIKAVGGASAMARLLAFKVTPQAVAKWMRRGHLPKTELTGSTDYANVLAAKARSMGFEVKVAELREEIPL